MSRLVPALSATGFAAALVLSLATGTPQQLQARSAAKAQIPAALLTLHQKYPDCVRPDDPTMPKRHNSFIAKVADKTMIYGILCEPSAYNWPYAVYVVRNGKAQNAERLNFAKYERASGWTGSNVLFNAQYDPESKQLESFSKARGAGDCGSQSILQWDGSQFTLIEYRYKEQCDGKTDKPFPLIYKRAIGTK